MRVRAQPQAQLVAEERRAEALPEVEREDEEERPDGPSAVEEPRRIRRADVAAPDGAQVDALGESREEPTERNAADRERQQAREDLGDGTT